MPQLQNSPARLRIVSPAVIRTPMANVACYLRTQADSIDETASRCTDGVSIALTVAAFSFWTIAAGVPLGRKNAFQVPAAKLATPCSWADASAGRFGERFMVRMARAFTVWLAICGIATVLVGHQ